MEAYRGWFAAAQPSIVKKKLVSLLLEIEATCPLKVGLNIVYLTNLGSLDQLGSLGYKLG